MKKNKIFFYVLIIFIIIILGFFIYKIMTKNQKKGNNISSQKIVDNILNVKSYKAKIIVQINSNKNKNKYVLEQEYDKENGSIQIVIEPLNIAGIRIIKKDGTISLENTNLNLAKVYENYQGLEENYLDLISFIEEYKNSEKSEFEEKNAEIIMKTNIKKNNIENKKLYINKDNNLPTKLIIEDDNKKIIANIEYNEIQLKYE